MLLTALLHNNGKAADSTFFPCLDFGSHRIRNSMKCIMQKKRQKVSGYLVGKLLCFVPDETPQVQDVHCSYQRVCADLMA